MDGTVYRGYVIMGDMLHLKWKFNSKYWQTVWYLKDKFVDVIISTVNWPYSHLGFDVSASETYWPGQRIISIEPYKGLHQSSIVKPFTWYIWILVVVCIPTVGLTLYGLLIADDAPKPKAPTDVPAETTGFPTNFPTEPPTDSPTDALTDAPADSTGNDTDTPATVSSGTVANCMWVVTVILLWDSIQMKNPSRGVCVLLGTYMLMTCLLIYILF